MYFVLVLKDDQVIQFQNFDHSLKKSKTVIDKFVEAFHKTDNVDFVSNTEVKRGKYNYKLVSVNDLDKYKFSDKQNERLYKLRKAS